MDRTEIQSLAGVAFSHWNQGIPSSGNQLKNIISAWHDALHDISYEDAKKAIEHLALTETYLPRPLQIRKQALISIQKIKPAPSGASAWAILQNVARDVNTGVINPQNMHEVVLTTIQRMGGVSAISADTNGDRNFFLEVYKEVLGEWEKKMFDPPPSGLL